MAHVSAHSPDERACMCVDRLSAPCHERPEFCKVPAAGLETRGKATFIKPRGQAKLRSQPLIHTEMSNSQKFILVIGATGAQGKAVIDALLAPAGDGSLSPYAIRALTRDPHSSRAKELTDKGVECVQGECISCP